MRQCIRFQGFTGSRFHGIGKLARTGFKSLRFFLSFCLSFLIPMSLGTLILLFIFLFCATSSFAFELPRFVGKEIVVTALRKPVYEYQSPWKTKVINPDDFKMTLYQTLDDLAGIDVRATGYLGASGTVRLRGATSQQVLVLKDGVRINSPLLGLIDFNDLFLSGTKSVEIVKAPLSSIYGSDAIGGVVNIISKKTVDKTGLGLSYGTYNTQNYEIYFGNQLNNFDYSAFFNAIKSDGFRENSEYAAYDLLGSINLFNKWNFALSYYDADKGISGVPNSPDDLYSASTPDNRQKDKNLFINLGFEDVDGKVNTSLKIYNNMFITDYHSYNFSTSLFEDTQYRANEIGANFSRGFGSHLFGFDGKIDTGDSPYIGIKREISNNAAYFQENLEKGPLSAVFGGRLDQNSKFGSSINPRIGVNYSLPLGFAFRSSYGTAFKAPTLNDLYWNDSVWLMYGNEALQPEKSQSYELGFSKNFWRGGVVDLSYYKTATSNLISWNYDPSTFTTTAVNFGAVDSSGVELDVSGKIGKSLTVFANATWQEAKIGESLDPSIIGNYLPYTPNTKYNIGFKWEDVFKLSLRNAGNQFSDSSNQTEIPAYSVVDALFKRMVGDYSVILQIDNLFDQSYYESVGLHPVTWETIKYPMPGRVITVKMGSTF